MSQSLQESITTILNSERVLTEVALPNMSLRLTGADYRRAIGSVITPVAVHRAWDRATSLETDYQIIIDDLKEAIKFMEKNLKDTLSNLDEI